MNNKLRYKDLRDAQGNVLAVISDTKNADGTAKIVSASDYYPFGMQMPARTLQGEGYRYGFGGHEKDDEVSGNGNHLSFAGYGYNPRLGRRFGLDPVDQMYISNYAAFRNSPIFFIDPDGRFNLPNYSDEELSNKGLTRDEMDRFTTVVTNIGNLVNNNQKALDVISNSTGLSHDQILNDFKFGEGPTLNIEAVSGNSQANNGSITIDAQAVKDLASVDFNAVNRYGHKELARQAFATSMLIVHEYGHYGDQKTNDGYNTGQFAGEQNYVEIFGDSNNKMEGSQEWSLTKTGHRGVDITTEGFGADVSAGVGGHLLLKTSNASQYLKGNYILDLLKIKK